MATVTKQQMVQAALDDGRTSPTAGIEFVRERFGVTMTRRHFSNAKNVLTSKAGAGAKAGKATAGSGPAATARPPREKPAGEPAAASPPRDTAPPADAPPGKPSPAELARQLKRLVADHGAEAVRDMLAVFAE